MSKDILPKDADSRYHGLCVAYFKNDQTCWSGARVHGEGYGYQKSFYYSGNIDKHNTGYLLDHNYISAENVEGYCYVWNRLVV